MTKQDIVRTMRTASGGAEFITITEIAAYCGKSRDWVRQQIVTDLEYLKVKRTKSYFVGDVAQRIIDNLQS